MWKMNRRMILGAVVKVSFAICSLSMAAGSVITFEDLPDSYFFSSGDQNIGNYYPGMSFGPDVTALSVSRFGGYDSSAFPPHSGDVAIWDAIDPTITISFSTSLTSFGIWYTSFDPLTLKAIGASGQVLGTVVGTPNTDGTTGISSFLSFSGVGLQSVQLTSTPGLFVLDDLTYDAVPESGASFLVIVGLLFFALYRWMLSRVRQPCPGVFMLRLGRSLVRLFAEVLLLLAFGMMGLSQSLTIGAPGDSGGITIPFGTLQYSPPHSLLYQQVYNQADFPPKVCHGDVCTGLNGYTINSISFTRNAANLTPPYPQYWTIISGTWTIELSTTNVPVNGLDASNLSNNLGFHNQVFFSGYLGALALGQGQDLTFTGVPYTYYPSAGNLLVTISLTNPGDGGLLPFDGRIGDSGGAFSSVLSGDNHGCNPYPNINCNIAYNDTGLVTVFGWSAAPPSTASSITSQPLSQNISSGSSATLSVGVAGTAPFQYQWYQGSSPIPGATASTYSTGPLSETTTYSVAVSNESGSVTSTTATITVQVCMAASIATQPNDQTVTSGNSVTLSVGAAGTGLQYQWYSGGIAIAGATSSTYTTGILTSGMSFYVVVTGQCGSPVTSRTAIVTVTPICTVPAIVTQPSSQTVISGTSATLNVVANGSALKYQWYQSGGVPIAGATSATYTTPPVTAAADYYVFVSNTCGQQQSPMVLIEPNLLLGPPSPLNPTATAAEPVNTATGNYYSAHIDMQVRGRGMPFSFARTYNSNDTYSGPLGTGWTHSYNLLLSTDSQSGVVSIKQGDGSFIVFAPVGAGSYKPVTVGLFDGLVKNADGSFTLRRKNQVQLIFSTAGKLVNIVDRNGNTQTLTYDSNANLISVTDTVGRSFTFANDSSGRLISINDPMGRIVQYSYDSAGNLATFKDARGGLTQYTYDVSHRLISGTDARGVVYVQNTYDSQGRVMTQKNGKNLSTTFAYNTPSSGITTFTDSLGNATKHVYDSNLRIVQIVNAQNGTASFSYDANNDRTAVTNTNGKTTQFVYDGRGNVTSVTDPLGDTASFTYDAFNDILQATNPAGNATTFSYDGSENLTSIADALGDKTIFAYDGFGELVSLTSALGNKTTLTYDADGNLIKILDAAGDTAAFGYDGISRVITATDGNGQSFSIAYDALSRRTKSTDALGDQTQYAYDAVGNLLQVIDANGNPTAYQYDNLNNLVTVKDALGGTTTYGYDGNNNRISFTNAKGNTTAYTFDSLNRRTKVTDPLGFFSTYSYDTVGNVVSVTDANGKTHSFVYDALNRPTTRTYADGNVISYKYDVNGNRTSMTDAHGTTSYSYDVLNRVASVTSSGGSLVKYGYDGVGHRASLTYPDGRLISYSYDNAERLSQVKDWLGRTTIYKYDAAGNRTAVSMGNGASAAYSFDNANRLLSVVNSSGGRALASYTYVLDKVGNRVQVTDAAGGITSYGYDALNRLTTWTAPSGQLITYAHDAVGNRASVTTSTGVTSYTNDADDRLLTAGTSSFTYDGNGNRLTKTTAAGTVAYSFDSLNRLTAVSGAGIAAEYQYDGDGNRIAQQVGTSAYQYALDVVRRNVAVLNESGLDGNIDYQYGLSLLSGSGATLEQFYQTDGMGSTADVTDATGSLKASYSYDPWGKLLNPIDPLGTKDKFKFAGEALDPQTGLYFLRDRYYDPTLGRFISKDPFPGFVDAPLTTNRYNYALGNPLLLADPSGFAAEPRSSDTAVVQPLFLAPSNQSSLGFTVQQSVSAYSGGPASMSDGYGDEPESFAGFLGVVAVVGVAAVSPEAAEEIQPWIENALDTASPPTMPSTVLGAVSTVAAGAKDLWSGIATIGSEIGSGISNLYTNLVTYNSQPQSNVSLQLPQQQQTPDFSVQDLSNYQD